MKLALTALGFILTGMVMGNSVLLGLGLIPLIFTIVSTNISGPSLPTLESLPESIILNVDDELTLEYTGFELSPGGHQKNLYRLFISGGREESMNELGSFLEDDAWILLEATP